MEKNITITHKEKFGGLRLFVEYVILVLCLLIIIPAGVLIVTKDTLPGESLYRYKLQIEDAALSIVKETSFESQLKKIILGRRLQERELMKKLDKMGK